MAATLQSPTVAKAALGQDSRPYYGLQNQLYSSIIDVALVYGIDETTCRSLDMNESGANIQEVYHSLLQRDVTLRFLQVLAPGRVYPQRGTQTVDFPGGGTDPQGQASHKRKFRIEDIGLAWETLETLQIFMYPDGVQMYSENIEPSLLPLTLTNVEGSRSYAVGLKFARPFFIENIDNGQYKLTPWTLSGGSSPSYCKLIYLPTCVVLVSSKPVYSFMKDALSGLFRLISVEDKEVNFWEMLHDFVEKVFLIPTIPENSTMAVEVQLPGFQSVSRLMPPRQSTYLDIRLDFPFRFLSVEDVLVVVGALLSEQRILIFSSQLCLPGMFIQCILSYIQPFEFRHPIVSILPKEQLELLGAIGTNIMGCHSDALNTPDFKDVDDAVLVYLDEGHVECRLSPEFPLHPLPQAPAYRFKTQYEQLMKSMQYEIETLERLTLGSSLERENTRFYFHHYLDTKILEFFLELLVRVYGDITDCLKQSRAVFEEKLKKLPEVEQLFYKHVVQTDMYSVFLTQRRNNQRDSFNILADQIKLIEKKGSLTMEDLMPDSMSITKELKKQHRKSFSNIRPSLWQINCGLRSLSKGSLTDDRLTPPMSLCLHGKMNFYKDLQFLELPQFDEGPQDRIQYINSVLKVLDYLAQDKDNKPVCTFLSAHYQIAKGKVVQGLDEFCETLPLLKTSMVPPPNDLMEFMTLLNAEDKETVMERSYYKQLIPRGLSHSSGRHMTQVGMSRPIIGTRNSRRARKPMAYASFLTEVQQESIARDAESATNLFSVLQFVGHSATVTPEVFQTFLDSWHQVLVDNEKMTSEVTINPPMHEVEESVLTYVHGLKCTFSQHCTLVLTTHRLIVLSQAGWRERTFANLSELELGSFNKCDISLHYLGPKTPVIKLDGTQDKNDSRTLITKNRTTNRRINRTDMYLGFSDEIIRDIWYRIIKEVISGWKIIFNRRDPSVMDEVECHVKMMMTVLNTGWVHSLAIPTKLKIAQKLLIFHSKPITDNTGAVEALQYRINPNIHQTEKATIESTIFIPADICGGEGKLMLGMGNALLRVYDMEARCFESDLKIADSKRRLTCLLLVDYHVWVGRLGRTIHILDVETLCHVSQLSYLEDDPREMCLSQTEPRVVWTLLLNGTLIGFDPDTRERVARIQVPGLDTISFCYCFTVWRDSLWVGTSKGTIAIMSTKDYNFRRTITFPGIENKQVEVKCLAVSSEDEIWCSVHTVPRSPDSTYVAVFNPRNDKQLYHYTCPDSDHKVSFILPFKHTVWCGTKCGEIMVFGARTETNMNGPKVLSAHDDKIRSMAATDTDYVISGTGSNDGYANVWKLMNWFDD